MAAIYKVKQGDCISSIAFEHGHFWETIWNDSDNAELNSEREDPNVLRQGDKIHIPDLRKREESVASDAKHSFRLLGVPAKLRIRIMEDDIDEDAVEPDCPEPQSDGLNFESETAGNDERVEQVPCADAPYSIDVDGCLSDGTTDRDGYIDIPLTPNAKKAVIRLNPGTEKETELEVELGHLDPISEITGIKKRLQKMCCQPFARGPIPVTPQLKMSTRSIFLFLPGVGLMTFGISCTSISRIPPFFFR